MSDRARSILADCETINGWASGSNDAPTAEADAAAEHLRARIADWYPAPWRGESWRGDAHAAYDDAVLMLCRRAVSLHAARTVERARYRAESPAAIGGRLP